MRHWHLFPLPISSTCNCTVVLSARDIFVTVLNVRAYTAHLLYMKRLFELRVDSYCTASKVKVQDVHCRLSLVAVPE